MRTKPVMPSFLRAAARALGHAPAARFFIDFFMDFLALERFFIDDFLALERFFMDERFIALLFFIAFIAFFIDFITLFFFIADLRRIAIVVEMGFVLAKKPEFAFESPCVGQYKSDDV